MSELLTGQTCCSSVKTLESVPSLKLNFAWTFGGNVVYAGCQWGILMILARMGGPAAVGEYALGLAVSAPIFLFFNLQLRSLIATDASGEYAYSSYASARLSSTLIALIITGLCAFTSSADSLGVAAILAIALSKAAESASDLSYGYLQQWERMDVISRSLLLRGLLSLGGVALTAGLGLPSWCSALAVAAVWALVWLCHDLPPVRLMDEQLSWRDALGRTVTREVRTLIWRAMPLGIVMALISFGANVPRYFLQAHHGKELLGIMAALSYGLVVITMVVDAMGKTVTPRLARCYVRRDRPELIRLTASVAAIGFGAGVAGIVAVMLVGTSLINVLLGWQFSGYGYELILLFVAATISGVASALGYLVTAARYFRIQMPAVLTVTLSLVLFCAWLVPRGGVRGAAEAVLAGAVVHLLVYAAIAVHVLYWNWNENETGSLQRA